MKIIMILYLFVATPTYASCLISFELKTTSEEEQVKGPLKKTTVIDYQFLIKEEDVSTFETSPSSHNPRMIISYKNKRPDLDMEYDVEAAKDIQQQIKKCNNR